jgi:hypothetical protein
LSTDPDGGLPTNRKAVYSLLLGVAAFPCALFVPFLGFVLAVPAVTTGVHGRREISAGHGAEGGDVNAVIGLTFGATTLALLLVSWLVEPLLG